MRKMSMLTIKSLMIKMICFPQNQSIWQTILYFHLIITNRSLHVQRLEQETSINTNYCWCKEGSKEEIKIACCILW